MNKTYIDHKDYLRFKDSDKLVHRWIAYKEIYLKDKKNYPLDFKEYQVHHVDGNKQNNEVANLKLKTLREHESQHGFERIEMQLIKALVLTLIAFILLFAFHDFGRERLSDIQKFIGNITIVVLFYITLFFITRKRKNVKII